MRAAPFFKTTAAALPEKPFHLKISQYGVFKVFVGD
jgi:hypothetical protein